MLKYRHNLVALRLSDASVRLLQFKGAVPDEVTTTGHYPDTRVDMIIDADTWAAIVADVSALGTHGGRWQSARRFHLDDGSL